MDEEELSLSDEIIAEASEVFATFDRDGLNAVPSSELGNMMNAMGLFFPLSVNANLITFKDKKKPLFSNTLKQYKTCIRRFSASGKLTLFAFLSIVDMHLSAMNPKFIDNFMLTYESQIAKGRHYFAIKGQKVPSGFDMKDMKNYMTASELRKILLGVCKKEVLTDAQVSEYLKSVGIVDSNGTMDYAAALKKFGRFDIMTSWRDELPKSPAPSSSLPVLDAAHLALEAEIRNAGGSKISF